MISKKRYERAPTTEHTERGLGGKATSWRERSREGTPTNSLVLRRNQSRPLRHQLQDVVRPLRQSLDPFFCLRFRRRNSSFLRAEDRTRKLLFRLGPNSASFFRLGPKHALRQASLTRFRRGKASLLSLMGASEARQVSVLAKEHQQKACRGKKLRPTQENNRFDRWLLQIQA